MVNRQFSYASHKRSIFTDFTPDQFVDDIVGASFCQDNPFTDVFPELPDGQICRLINCNLDNCNIPAGYEVVGGTNKQIELQTDGEKWVIGADRKPIEPLHKSEYVKLGLSVSPNDLPVEKLDEPITISRARLQRVEDESRDLSAQLRSLAYAAPDNPARVSRGAKAEFTPDGMTGILSADGKPAQVQDLSGEWI